jgi:hypothetical protein
MTGSCLLGLLNVQVNWLCFLQMVESCIQTLILTKIQPIMIFYHYLCTSQSATPSLPPHLLFY